MAKPSPLRLAVETAIHLPRYSYTMRHDRHDSAGE